MECLNVDLDNNSYPIVITNNFDDFLQYKKNFNEKYIVITDSNVTGCYLREFIDIISKDGREVLSYVVKAGEESKCLGSVEDIYYFLMSNKVCRNDIIISLGGGVIGDLAGFVAATFLRGIDLIHVPTSLLAQVDSSIGGKTAVNLSKSKNLIGAFYQPKLVYSNYSVLKTLPEDEVKNGLIEILVHSIIKDADLFEYIEDNLEKILSLDSSILEKLISRNCSIKKSVVEKDEKDTGERAILNFGHTFGHAIESSYEYKYKHGKCVALGIIGACFMAERLNFTDESITKRIIKLIKKIGILEEFDDCDKGKILDYLVMDKKFVEGRMIFILPVKIGKVVKCEIKDFEIIKEALERLIAEFI